MNEPVGHKPEKPTRRVGTFTVGATLIVAGCAMLAKLSYPSLDLIWLLRLSPCILIGLGVETLLASRTDSRLRYDWAGILLTFLVGCLGVFMTGAVWYLLEHPEYLEH